MACCISPMMIQPYLKMETGSQEFIQMVVKDLEDHFNDDPSQIMSMSSGGHRESSLLGRGQSRNSSQTIVFTQGPIMEDDDIDNGVKDSDNDSGDDYEVSEVITGDNISDSEHAMLRSAQSNRLVSSSDRNRMIVSNHPGYIAMKPQCVGLGDIVYGQNTMGQIILQEGVDNEMIVEEKVEVGDENHDTADVPHDEIILVPNSLLKHEIIEGGEVIVGTNMHPQNVGNEIVIGDHMSSGRHHSSIQLTDIDDDATFDSNLIIDTSAIKDEVVGSSIGYDCGECGSVLKSRGALKKHISKYHDSIEPEIVDVPNRIYNCSSCTYQTARRDKLDKHISKHIAEGFSPSGKKRNKATPPQRMRHAAEEYKCPLCPYRCTVEKAFKKHMKLHQAGTKHFVVKVSCKICGKDRSSETDLRKHMKKHKDDKDFVCDVCGFASIQLKKIIQHRRMHTGEKPHLCPHCAYRSARRDNLRSHVRRMHKKENMYIDTFNPRSFVEIAKTIGNSNKDESRGKADHFLAKLQIS
uniref:C2H2-type domain-containing protein n=1 Tax=Strigamia maritima TaxID=126957 RepID=T1JCG9_STRMM